MKKKFTFISLLLLLSFVVKAQSDINVYSKSMHKDIMNQIYIPSDYTPEKKYPVLYLLHGHGGNQKSWGGIKKNLKQEATTYQMIIVTPNGENSWYWDSLNNKELQFETYISKELVNHIDSAYSTITSPSGRAITGFSMGGHGGLWLGINHPDIFGACGSMSGGVDIRPFPNSWNMKDAIGKYKDNPEQWDNHTVIDQLYKIEPNSMKIIIDCGTQDFFFGVNEELHKKLLQMNIPHDYITRPGGHTIDYWRDAVDYQLLFFHKFFEN